MNEKGQVVIVVAVVVWVICGILASLIWQHKGGKAFSGFVIGLLLGLIGLVYVAVANAHKKRWLDDPVPPGVGSKPIARVVAVDSR